MKKIMIIGLIILSIFLIYLCNLDRKVYYLAINSFETGSTEVYTEYVKNYLKEKDVLEVYVDDYSKENLTTTDLQTEINSNKKIIKNDTEITLKNALIKADLVTLSFSGNDVINRISSSKVYDYIDELGKDLDDLLKLIREYCKEDIILVGYYDPILTNNSAEVFKYLNKKYSEICEDNNVNYIDLTNSFENQPDFLDENKFPTQSGENMIASRVIEQIDKKLLNT